MLTSVKDSPSYLIVDDSPLSLKWLVRMLESTGSCEIVEARDGVEAVEKLASGGDRFDAIISDLQMPRMNGLEFLREVRLAKTGARQSVPFFIVTGFADRTLAGLALGLDVDAFLARPVKQQALNRHLIRTSSGRWADKTPAEAQAAYADVDLSPVGTASERPAAEPKVVELGEALQSSASVAVLDTPPAHLMALESVPDGARLARDATNSAGTVLLKAGDQITAGLKEALRSYAEIDESLAKVWVQSAA